MLAGKYIQQYLCPPPVLFDELMKMDMSAELRNGIGELLEIKKRSDESEKGVQIPVIREFIIEELERQNAYVESISDDRKREWENLDDIFLKILKQQ